MKLLLFTSLLLISVLQIYADTLKLKSGVTIKGKIVQADREKVLVVEENKGNSVSYFNPDEIIETIYDKEKTTESNELQTHLFGRIKSDFTYSDNAVLSYGVESQHSPTSVKREVMARDASSRSGISAAHTMLGYSIDYGKKINGTIMLDFVDLSQSNAIIASKPRILMALGTYKPNSKYEIFGGQTFDIFSNLIPHTYNMPGLMNEAGNAGFTRQQFGIKYKFSKFIFTTALGMPNISFGKSSPSLDSDLNKTPTLAGNIKYEVNEKINIYLSAITVDLKVRQPLIDSNRDNLYLYWDLTNVNNESKLNSTFPQSYRLGGDGVTTVKCGGYSFGLEFDAIKNLSIKSEINYGENLGSISASGLSRIQTNTYGQNLEDSNLGILTSNDPLAQSFKNSTEPVFRSAKELGGWLSFEYKITQEFAFGLHGSAAKILNPEDLNSANRNSLYKSQPETTGNYWYIDSIVGALRENSLRGYRLSYSPEPKITFFFQHDYMVTLYKDSERNRGLYNHIESININTGEIKLRPVAFSYLSSSARAEAHMIRMGIMIPF